MSNVLLEALCVTALGVGLAFATNSWRDDGLELTRDYFPQGLGDSEEPVSAAVDEALTDSPAASEVPEVTDLDHHGDPASQIHAHVADRLAEKGLTAVSHDDAVALWRDPMFQEYEATVFLDARRVEQYDEGHIPGAWHFDPFYPERTIDDLLPLLSSAMTIVVYCKGGECDDSESAALYLLNLGAADSSRLSIYVGGIEAWTAAQLPIEQGQRGSGEGGDPHDN